MKVKYNKIKRGNEAQVSLMNYSYKCFNAKKGLDVYIDFNRAYNCKHHEEYIESYKNNVLDDYYIKMLKVGERVFRFKLFNDKKDDLVSIIEKQNMNGGKNE